MKKSLSIWFAFLIAILCGVCGFFLFAKNDPAVEVTTTNEVVDILQVSQEVEEIALAASPEKPVAQFSNLGAKNGYENYVYTPFEWSYDHIIYNVVLMNFKDYSVFTEDNYTTYAQKLDEAAEYINIMSRGITTIEFNYYIYNNPYLTMKDTCEKPYDFNTELDYMQEGLRKGKCVSSCGDGMGSILMIAYDGGSYGYKTLAHDHVWYAQYFVNRIMIVKSTSSADVYAHELLHTVGLTDLYNYNLYPMCCDMMCEELMALPVNSYSRYKLGWLDQSYANDTVSTAIETLTQSGRYTINDPFSQTGTISYQFGSRNGESFYIEASTTSAVPTLYVYKINTNYKDNVNAKYKRELQVEIVNFVNNNYKYPSNIKVTPTYKPIKYADGVIIDVSIGNVALEDNGQISFDFFYGNETRLDGTVTVKDKQTNKIVPNVDVYINDIYQTTTDKKGQGTINATSGDVMKLSANKYIEGEFYITGAAFNSESRNIVVTIASESVNDLYYKFDITVENGAQSYKVSPNDVVFSVNNQIVNYSLWGINLVKGDLLEISSNNFKTLTYRFIPFMLSGKDEILMENYTFYLTATPKTNTYFINLYNDQEELAVVHKITAFNCATNSWDEISNIRIVNKNGIKYYQLVNIAGSYTRFSFEYSACGFLCNTIVFLENNKFDYRQKLDKNVIQIAGDTITSIGTGVKDIFDGIFKNIFN